MRSKASNSEALIRLRLLEDKETLAVDVKGEREMLKSMILAWLTRDRQSAELVIEAVGDYLDEFDF